MFREWEKYLKPKQDEVKEIWPAIICDLDGTLALLNGRSPYDASTCENDELNTLVRDVWDSFDLNEHVKILVSGRSDKHREQTERWLKNNFIK